MGKIYSSSSGGKSISLGSSKSHGDKRHIYSGGKHMGYVKDGKVYNSAGHYRGEISENKYGGKQSIKDASGREVGYREGTSVHIGGQKASLDKHSSDRSADAAGLLLMKDVLKKVNDQKTSTSSDAAAGTRFRNGLSRLIFGENERKPRPEAPEENEPRRGYPT